MPQHNRALQDATFDAVVATEYPVPRSYGTEVLVCSAEAIDLTRFPLPVLTLHDSQKLPIGVARNPVITDGQLRAEVYLDDSEDGLKAAQSITDGVLNHVSVGYQISETQDGENGESRATSWMPYEVSLVSVPADPNARISKRGIRTMTTEAKALRKDASEIMMLAKRHNMVDEGIKAIEKGVPLDQWRAHVIDSIATTPIGSYDIGLSDREARSFSLTRAIEAQASNDWSKAGLEREVLRETAKHTTRSNAFVVPVDVLEMQTRDILKTNSGGSVVGTTHMGGSFIDYLHTQSDVLDRCTMMNGLQGDVSIPRLTGAATAGWYAEQGSITGSTPTFDNLTLAPEVLAGMVSYSRKLLAQSEPMIESLVRRDLATVLGLELDRAILNGSGSNNQPTGILNTAGIGDVALGTDGAAIEWGDLMRLIEAVASANADGSGVFVINSATEAYLRATPRIPSTDSRLMLEGNEGIAGRPVVVSNNMPSNLTKGNGTNLSAVVYGDLRQVLVGMWSGLEIVVDPYTLLDQSTIRVAAFIHTDVGIRHVESFAAIQDAVTTI